MARFLRWTAWSTPLLELGSWAAVRLGDRVPVCTLIAYGPRWIWLTLPVVLLPLCASRRRLLLPLATALAIGIAGTMQFRVGIPRPSPPDGRLLRVVTFNADSLHVGESLSALAARTHSDIVAAQELDDPGPLAGWSTRCASHLCTASRYPILSFEYFDRRLLGGYFAAATAAVIDTPGSPVTFINLHLETPRKGIEPVQHSGLRGWPALQDNLSFRDIESRAIAAWVRARADDSVIIAGDFNQPSDSAIYRRYWRSWTNAFDTAGWGFGYTKFTSWWGIRIDHVLSGSKWQAVHWEVGPNLGSDHRPVLVTLRQR